MLQHLFYWIIGLGCLVAVAQGCSSGPEVAPIQPMEAYGFRQDVGEVRVALDPLFTAERARAVFPGGETFVEQGLLPIQVVIENRSSQAVRSDRGDFRLVRPGGQADVALSVQDAFSMVKPPVGWWAALPILGPSASAVRNSDWLKQFESRALKDIPIPAGGSAAGFIYFYSPESEKNLEGVRVTFALRSDSGAERRFEIPLQGRRDLLGPAARPGPSAAPGSRSQAPPQIPTRVEGVGGGVIIRSPAP